MDYRREIDGLRALAVLPVILFHAGFDSFSGGFVGVDVFFVISGYLITSIILAELEAGTFSLLRFYERRARRILPALFFVMAACIPFAWLWLLPGDMQSFSQSLIAVALFVSNLLFWNESGYFDIAAELKPLLHTWSLALEEQYYVLFPLCLMLFWRWGRHRTMGLLAAGTVFSLAAAEWGAYNKPAATFFLLPTRAWELGMGALLAFYPAWQQHPAISAGLRQAASALGALLIVYAVFAFNKITPFPSLYALVPTLGAALIIVFATPATAAGKLLGSKAFVGLGLISYSAYLWHQPLFAFARHRSLQEPGEGVLLLLAAVAVLLAYFSWRFIERPFRAAGVVGRQKLFFAAAAASLVLIVFGLFGHYTNGFSFRIPTQQTKILSMLMEQSTLRNRAIKVDVCFFQDVGKTGVDVFLAQWHCKAPSSPPLKKLPLAITGDSHAADLVVALNQNGYSPLHLSGAGCSLVPRFMTPQCKKIFSRLRDELRADPFYTHIALANQYGTFELSARSVAEMLEFWRGFDKQIILFVGMPHFPLYKEKLSRGATPAMDLELSLLSKRSELLSLYRENGVHVVDRDEYFCAINECKYFANDGSPLLVDPTHLSIGAAKMFGEGLLSTDPVFKNLLERSLSGP